MFFLQVKSVAYPGLESHPGHKYAKQLMKKFSGMVAFNVGTAENAAKIVQVKEIISSKNIFNFISLSELSSMQFPWEELNLWWSILCRWVMESNWFPRAGQERFMKEWSGLGKFCLIIWNLKKENSSVGIENVEDLIADLDQAL